MEPRLACADFTFPLLDHDGVLHLIQLMDFTGVDIGLFEGRSHLQPSQELCQPEQAGMALRQKMSDRGLVVADVFLQMDPDFVPYAINHPEASRRQKARDWYCRVLDYAEACGCPHVTILPGVHFDGELPGVSLQRTVAELTWRLEQAASRHLVCSVEAHVGSLVDSPQAANHLVSLTPGLTLTLDYTHFTRQGVPDAIIEPLVPHASHFHFRGACTNRLQTSFAHNTIDYGRVLDVMAAHGYTGWHAVEYVWIDWEHCNECDNVAETIRFRDFIRAHCQVASPHPLT